MKKLKGTIGVIVGRFQSPCLHKGYHALIQHASQRHTRVCIFLGCTPAKGQKHDPLDFDSRKLMILEMYPEVEVYPLNDVGNVDRWSKHLDERIRFLLSDNQRRAVLYGSRDKFKYTGGFPVITAPEIPNVSASNIRTQIGKIIKNTQDWREGVIWLTQNLFPTVYTTVDIAVIDGKNERVLLGKKPNADVWQFPGGFADVGNASFEEDALREMREETCLIGENPVYIGSTLIDDYRYRVQDCKIKTLFFVVTNWSGDKRASDDLAELEWRSLKNFNLKELAEYHLPLWKMLSAWRKENA